MAEQKGRTKMGEEKAGVEGPSGGPSAPEKAGIAEHILAAMLAVEDSINHLSYFHAQIDAEMRKEAAERADSIRLNVASTVLNGLLCAGTNATADELANLAVHHTDALLSRLGMASTASAPKEPPGPPSTPDPEAQRG